MVPTCGHSPACLRNLTYPDTAPVEQQPLTSNSSTQNCQSGLEENFVSGSRPRAGQLHFTGLTVCISFSAKKQHWKCHHYHTSSSPEAKEQTLGVEQGKSTPGASSSRCRKVEWLRCVLPVSKVI